MNRGKKWLNRIVIVLMACMLIVPITASAATIKLSKTGVSLRKGNSYTLTLRNSQDEVTWKSSKSAVASVDANGKITAKKKGTATITATSAGVKYKCKVTVKQPVTKITLNQKNIAISKGKTYTLKATVSPTNANNKAVAWSTSNKNIVTVTSKGKIKAIKSGTATITVKAKDGSGKKATCKIKVKAAATTSTSTSTSTNNSSSATGNQSGKSKAQQFLNILQKYSNQVKSDKAAGFRWGYSNSSSLAPNTWDKAYAASRSKGISYVNCALLPRWALREMGIINTKNFWGLIGGGIQFRGDVKEQLLKHCEIIKVYKTPNQLLAEGNLLPGDICTYVDYQHTNVYAGNGKFYDSGRNGAIGSWQNGTFIFNSFGPAATVGMSNTTIGHIIRFK